jgi:hypothetical protein
MARGLFYLVIIRYIESVTEHWSYSMPREVDSPSNFVISYSAMLSVEV